MRLSVHKDHEVEALSFADNVSLVFMNNKNRLQEHLESTGGDLQSDMAVSAAVPDTGSNRPVNNYNRPEGQNVGNFLTDRNTSKVLAPPGGASSFSLG